MACGFIANGVDLKLICINTKKHFKADEGIPSDFLKSSKYHSVFRNTDTSASGAFLNLFSSQSYFVSRFYFQEFAAVLEEELKTNSYDIIQLEGLFMGVYLDVIRKFSKAKITLRAHNVEYLIWERHLKNEKNVLKRLYLNLQTSRLKTFEKKICKEVDAIVAITEVDRKLLSAIAPGKVSCTCITGIDPEKYKNKGLQVKENSVFLFSSMDWMPNIEAVNWFLKNCFEKVKKEIPHFKLTIAGRNMPELFLKISDPNIEIIENVPDSALFYHTHSIMLVPLLSGSGLRIKIIEGMAYGKAIVSTSVGAEGINAERGKDLLIADDAESFSNAVILLLKDPSRKNELERNARAYAEKHFDNKNVVKELVQFYSQLNA